MTDAIDHKLPQFLRDAAGRKFELGAWDCGLWLGAWYAVLTDKPDPAAHLRGASYDPSDLVKYTRAIARAVGLRLTRDPRPGDIGIVRLGGVAIGAICTGKHWVMPAQGGGLSTIRVEAVRSITWRVS